MSPLLNYTTEIQVAKTVTTIHGLLIKGGARAIMSNYDERGVPTAIGFTVETPLGPRSFRLPVNTAPVLAVLRKQRVAPRYATREQAERVGWRILKDWLEAQLAIIETEMVTLDQVMLPYMQADDGRTVYELYVEKALPELEAGPAPEVWQS